MARVRDSIPMIHEVCRDLDKQCSSCMWAIARRTFSVHGSVYTCLPTIQIDGSMMSPFVSA